MPYNVGERIDITADLKIASIPAIKGMDSKLVNKGLEYGEVEVIISNSGTDRHGEQILLEGIDLKEIKRNPVVLWSHNYSELPIGKISKIWKSGGNLMGRIQFDYDIYDFADTVYKMVVRGTLNAVSIGGMVLEFDENDYSVIKKLEMVELSVVPVGAHPDALVVSRGMNAEDVQKVNKEFDSFINNKQTVNKQLSEQVNALKSLVSALEGYVPSLDTEKTPKKRIRKLVLARSTTKQCDKQAELIIASINEQLRKE